MGILGMTSGSTSRLLFKISLAGWSALALAYGSLAIIGIVIGITVGGSVLWIVGMAFVLGMAAWQLVSCWRGFRLTETDS
jgi:hypothetical protein